MASAGPAPMDAETIIARLAGRYGMPVLYPHGDPVAELVLTVLSQNTADTNSGRAFTALMRRYPTWDAIADAPVDDLIEAIRIGGLAQQKAPRLKRILGAVREASPSWTLSRLRDGDLDTARDWLTALPGVGPKTAACVLLFALGRPAMPVDTHVERVSKRLALIPLSMPAVRAHAALEALVGAERRYAFHMLLIKHGRRTCHARSPHCSECPLLSGCPAGQAYTGLSPSAPSASPA